MLELSISYVIMVFVLLSTNGANSQILKVGITLVKNSTATALGAYCLDGSLPAYHLSRGFGSGTRNWILHFEGGGWCNDVESCLERTITRRGSSHYMTKTDNLTGILSNTKDQNPDFYNWNRVKLKYCDGASFAGNSKFDNGTSLLYFRGQKIWQAILQDLLPKGLAHAQKILLSGCSAGGLAVFLHCDNLSSFLPSNVTVKCLSDAGFFLDEPDIAMNRTIRTVYNEVVSLQGVEQYLDQKCIDSVDDPKLCFFPQYVLNFIRTPLFILNSAYDSWQFHNILVPFSGGVAKPWSPCKFNLTKCTDSQIQTLQDFRQEMVETLSPFYKQTKTGGVFINSCFAHCQSEKQDTWFQPDSPILNGKTVAEAVGDWYFERNVTMLIDCPYPCDKSCHNQIPS
ncbi:unnamed protein product [Amaranthus hypochondriacus]